MIRASSSLHHHHLQLFNFTDYMMMTMMMWWWSKTPKNINFAFTETSSSSYHEPFISFLSWSLLETFYQYSWNEGSVCWTKSIYNLHHKNFNFPYYHFIREKFSSWFSVFWLDWWWYCIFSSSRLHFININYLSFYTHHLSLTFKNERRTFTTTHNNQNGFLDLPLPNFD